MENNISSNPSLNVPMNSKPVFPTRLLGVALIILSVLFGGLYYFSQSNKPKTQEGYTIPNVPYFGVFSGYNLNSDVSSSAVEILRYWGDHRRSLDYVAFEALRPEGFIPLGAIRDFFKNEGYSAEIHQYNSVSDVLPYINPEKKIPIILVRKYTDRTDLPPLYGASVLIGVHGDTLEFHDYLFGTNYMVLAQNLRFLGDKTTGTFLTIEPSVDLLSKLKKQTESSPYPKRLRIMDDPQIIDINLRGTEIITGIFTGDTTAQTLTKWQELVKLPGFAKLHPSSQMYVYIQIGGYYKDIGDYTNAINVLKTKAISLNHDLNKVVGGWPRAPQYPKAFAYPWLVLGETYMAMKDEPNARKALETALSIEPNNPYVKNDFIILNGE